MTKFQKMAVLAGLVLASMCGAATAQDGAGGRRGPDIALIDLGKLLKESPTVKQEMEVLQKQVADQEAQFKKRRDELKGMVDQLASYKSGTREYEELEQVIAKTQSDMNVAVALQRKDFMKREARIYYQEYQRIQAAVDTFAAQHGIVAVLKFNSEPTDPEKPDEILRDLNKPVLWHHRQLDITERVRGMLGGGGAPSAGTATRNNAPGGYQPRQ